MKNVFLSFMLVTMCVSIMSSQDNVQVGNIESQMMQINQLSKAKWDWMADKNVEKLAELFHDHSKFVHMSGTWNKKRELDIIESGSIWYKEAKVHDVVTEVIDDTGIVWNRITLTAHVRGADVSNEFTVTEVYIQTDHQWQLLNMTFSKVRDTHTIEPNSSK